MAADNKLLAQFDLVGIHRRHGASRRSRSPSISMPTASSTYRPRQGEREGAKHPDPGVRRLERGRYPENGQGGRRPCEEDKRRKELVEARNQADAAIYSAEKALKEAATKITADLKKEAEQAIATQSRF